MGLAARFDQVPGRPVFAWPEVFLRFKKPRFFNLTLGASGGEDYLNYSRRYLREREARLMADAQRFRPYSSKSNAQPLPDHLAEEMVNTVNGLQVYEEELAKNTAERNQLRAEFDADITRFKELKGIK